VGRSPWLPPGRGAGHGRIAPEPPKANSYHHHLLRAMAEAGKIIHTDKEFVYKVMGKYLRLSDRKVLDAAYNGEVKVLETKLQMNDDGFQAILDEVS
jgi:hypothetical protein